MWTLGTLPVISQIKQAVLLLVMATAACLHLECTGDCEGGGLAAYAAYPGEGRLAPRGSSTVTNSSPHGLWYRDTPEASGSVLNPWPLTTKGVLSLP